MIPASPVSRGTWQTSSAFPCGRERLCHLALVGLLILCAMSRGSASGAEPDRIDAKAATKLAAAKPGRIGPQPVGGGVHPMTASRRTQQRFERCRELCGQKKFTDVLPVLQAFLDEPQDEFLPLGEKDKPDNPPRLASLKGEAEVLLCGLPAEARDSYELQFGTAAKIALDEATTSGDRTRLDEIAVRHFPTKAGGEAAWRAALARIDEGRFAEAADGLTRLRDRHVSAVAREPKLSFLVAVCAYRAGDLARGDAALDRLAMSHPDARFDPPGADRVPYDLGENGRRRLRERFAPKDAAAVSRGAWALPGGTPERTFAASVLDAPPVPKLPAAGVSLLVDPLKLATDSGETPLERMLVEIARPVVAAHHAVVPRKLPRCAPITVGHRVVARTIGNVRGLSLTSGARSWESIPDTFLEALMYGAAPPDRPTPVMTAYVRERLFDDWTSGMLACDGARVFAVEDAFGPQGFDANGQPEETANGATNRLVAYDALTGAVEWEIGGPPGEFALSESGQFFLGAPLVAGDCLYALAESAGMVRLLEIEGESGRVAWSQPVAELDSGWNVSQHRSRRMAGLSPTRGEGLLVCPIGGGLVVAVDPARRTLAWQRNLREGQLVPPRQFLPNSILPVAETGWLHDLPMTGRGAVLTPLSGHGDLTCLSTADGTVRWTISAGKLLSQPRFLAQASDGKFAVVGAGLVSLHRWNDGSNVTENPVAIPPLTGMGFASDGVLYLPVEENGDGVLLRVDLSSGKIASRSVVLKGRPLGNLACAGGLVVSQTAERIDAFTIGKPIMDEER